MDKYDYYLKITNDKESFLKFFRLLKKFFIR